MSSFFKPPHHELLHFALHLAKLANDLSLDYSQQNLTVLDKGGKFFDPLTEADTEVEKLIRSEIEHYYPEHHISGEEMEDKVGNSNYKWTLDPIDGTRNFISGVPCWSNLIALELNNQPFLGIANFPELGKMYAGFKGVSWLVQNGKTKPISVRKTEQLKNCIVSITTPLMFESDKEQELYKELLKGTKLVRFSLDSLGYCLLAEGKIDLVIESMLKPYDIKALIPIIQNAGGLITDWFGGQPLHNALCASQAIHRQVTENYINRYLV